MSESEGRKGGKEEGMKEGDPVSPHSDNQLVALFSHYGQAKKISSKTITKGYEQSLDLAIKWLEDELLR